jgi:hypothetical protein
LDVFALGLLNEQERRSGRVYDVIVEKGFAASIAIAGLQQLGEGRAQRVVGILQQKSIRRSRDLKIQMMREAFPDRLPLL